MDEATEVEGRDTQEGAVSAGQSVINMRRAVQRGEAVVGALSPTVLVWGTTEDVLETRVSAVTEALFQQGLVVRVEQAAASMQWLATIPGNLKYGIRARVLATPHLTALHPASSDLEWADGRYPSPGTAAPDGEYRGGPVSAGDACGGAGPCAGGGAVPHRQVGHCWGSWSARGFATPACGCVSLIGTMP